MARFVLGENFEARTAIELRSLGHDVATAATLNVRGTPDYRLLLVAVDDARIVITHNIDDFLLLHCTWQSLATRWSVSLEQASHPGILGMTQYTTDAVHYAQQIHARVQGPGIASEMHVYRPSTGWQTRRCS